MLILVSSILDVCDVIQTPPWDNAHDLTPQMVQHCLDNTLFKSTPLGPIGTVHEHAQRIAWLVQNGWDDAITIDVGVPWMTGWQPSWPISDGNHRLYAASIRGDGFIDVEAGGCVKTFNEMFKTNI